MEDQIVRSKLRRSLTLPWLVFYGMGVTVGAGIFALIGEILLLAGDGAPVSFLLAGVIAGATAVSYALLVRVFPFAGGEAVFVNRGLGPIMGWISGIGVVVTGIISSAAISLAFAGYAGSLIGVPPMFLTAAVIIVLAFVACWGIRESVGFAAVVTLLEVGTLAVVIIFGAPFLENLPPARDILRLDAGLAGLAPILSGALIAFFAYVGFEDIVNMAEETVEPARTVPRAIIWTLFLTLFLYLALAMIAISVPDRASVAGSQAPMSSLFEQVTGRSGQAISLLAAIAMINGILVQMIMSARVLYGMANESLLPAWFGKVSASRKTPLRATLFVSTTIFVLAASLPLVRLAELTSMVILLVFSLVNLSLFRLGGQIDDPILRRYRLWGIFGAFLCLSILSFSLFGMATVSH